jgi:hypothetical protein
VSSWTPRKEQPHDTAYETMQTSLALLRGSRPLLLPYGSLPAVSLIDTLSVPGTEH